MPLFWILLQITLSGAILVGLFVVGDVQTALQRMSWSTALALSVPAALVFSTNLFCAIRWGVLLSALGERVEAHKVALLTVFGTFCHQAVVSGLGEIVRVGYLTRRGARLGPVTTSVILDKIAGVAALVLMVVVAFALFWTEASPANALAVLAVILAPAVGIAILFSLDKFSPGAIKTWLGSRKHSLARLAERIIGFAETLGANTRDVFLRQWSGLGVLALSLAIQVALCATLQIVSDVLGQPIAFRDALIALPPSLLVAAVPISIGGWGVREGALAVGLTAVGMDSMVAIQVSLIFGLVLLAGNLPGALGWPLLMASDGTAAPKH